MSTESQAGAVETPRPAFVVSSLDALNLGLLAAAGVWCPLTHPVSGAPLVSPDGVAVRLKLAGADAPQLKAAGDAVQAVLLEEKVDDAALSAALSAQARAALLDWEGLPVPYSAEAAAEFWAAWPWAEAQALACLSDRSRYVGN